MGGPNSGRRRERNACALEDTVWLDLRLLRRWGFLRPGRVTRGRLAWSKRGIEIGACAVVIDLTDPAPRLEARVNGEARQLIELVRQPCPFGGERLYLLCPRTGARCVVLPFLDGQFASRKAHRITYGSQSEAKLDRLYRRRETLRTRLQALPETRRTKRKRLAARLDAANREWRRERSNQLRKQLGIP